MAAAVPTTILDAIIACGEDNFALFLGKTPAQHIAADIFDNTITMCMDITLQKLGEHFKTYSNLSQAQGQICVPPGTRKYIKAFVQWTCNKICLGCNPSLSPFPVNQVSDCL
jgi:hypothetical protein